MRAGDIVFSVANIHDDFATRIPRVFIRAGQWIKSRIFHEREPLLPIVHAAIAVDAEFVIESVGNGIVMTRLADDGQRAALVYTHQDPELARASALAARQFLDDRAGGSIRGRYDMWNAMLSIFRVSNSDANLMGRINESVEIGSNAFCSQFVANAYEVGNLYRYANLAPPPRAIFPFKPSALTPYDLAIACESDPQFMLSGFWEDCIFHGFAGH